MEWYDHGNEYIIGLCVSECIYPAEFPLFSGAAGVATRKMRSPIRLGRFYFKNWANLFHVHLYIKIFVVFFHQIMWAWCLFRYCYYMGYLERELGRYY